MPTYTDREILKNRQAGAAQTYGLSNVDTAIGQAHSDKLAFDKMTAALALGDDAMASTTTAETYTGCVNLYKGRIKAIYYIPQTGGITADASNNATITIKWRDSTGGNAVTVATYTTDVAGGSATQGVAKAMTLTQAANTIITALGSFTLTIAKTGSGVVVRGGKFVVEVENV